MQIMQNVSLKNYNSFGINAIAKQFAVFNTVTELQELLTIVSNERYMILGGGSNILFTNNFNGAVLKNEIKGIQKIYEDDEFVFIQAGAGENWHQFVANCISQGWGGLENLSLIPGNVGASPMQNIGAYGVEIKDVFHSLEAIHIKEKKVTPFSKADCSFAYRESVFKKELKNQFIILNVTFQLRKNPVYNTSYGAIEQELEKMGIKELSVKAVSDAVISIRSSKLPDPKKLGNAGSFFKNPTVSSEKYFQLKANFENIAGYPNTDGTVKLAAGWLIEQCGWKGYRKNDAGCHTKQALVLVNYGNASGDDILSLSTDIQQSVNEKFGVMLEKEVNIIS